MKGRVGSKHYDTDKATLIDTLPDGVQVYKKKNSPQFFIYNPAGTVARERFFELPTEDAAKYIPNMPVAKTGNIVYKSNFKIRFSPDNNNRIKRLATSRGMSMPAFLLMLVDEYERTHMNPCPVCGGEPEMVETDQYESYEMLYSVHCKQCGFNPFESYTDENKAIEAWNNIKNNPA